jgi:hypothetical protein
MHLPKITLAVDGNWLGVYEDDKLAIQGDPKDITAFLQETWGIGITVVHLATQPPIKTPKHIPQPPPAY